MQRVVLYEPVQPNEPNLDRLIGKKSGRFAFRPGKRFSPSGRATNVVHQRDIPARSRIVLATLRSFPVCFWFWATNGFRSSQSAATQRHGGPTAWRSCAAAFSLRMRALSVNPPCFAAKEKHIWSRSRIASSNNPFFSFFPGPHAAHRGGPAAPLAWPGLGGPGPGPGAGRPSVTVS